jgi:hypothetical protein
MSQDKPHEGRKEEDAADHHRPAELAGVHTECISVGLGCVITSSATPIQSRAPSLALLLSCRMFIPLTGIIQVPLPPSPTTHFSFHGATCPVDGPTRRRRAPITLDAVAAGSTEKGDGDRAAMANGIVLIRP